MLTTSYVLCTKSQTHRSGLRWNMLLCAITNSYIYGNESYHKPEQIKKYDVSICPFLINVSGKQYIPQISGCYLKHNRPRNIPCKKKGLHNYCNNDNIEYLFPEHVHKKYDN